MKIVTYIKTKIVVLIVASSITLFTKYSLSQEYNRSIRYDVPYFKTKTIFGKDINIYDIDSKIILIHFWASWCLNCREEFPNLLNFVKKYNKSISLISISIDNKEEIVHNFFNELIKDKQQNVYWVWDRNRNISLDLFNTVRVPETVIVYNKEIIHKVIGKHNWGSNKTKKIFNGLVNQ